MTKTVWIYHWPFDLYKDKKECIKYMSGWPHSPDAKEKAAKTSHYWFIFNRKWKIFKTNIPKNSKNTELFGIIFRLYGNMDTNEEVIRNLIVRPNK